MAFVKLRYVPFISLKFSEAKGSCKTVLASWIFFFFFNKQNTNKFKSQRLRWQEKPDFCQLANLDSSLMDFVVLSINQMLYFMDNCRGGLRI